jgi:hypothetical protein
MAFTSHRVVSDIFNLENVVQQTGIVHAKNILIDTLREVFGQDREFKYVTDVFGFPKTPSHLGLDPDAGLDDEETTRIFIGSTYRYDIKFNPSIIVKNTGTRYIPISFNRDLLSIIYSNERIVDGYGNETIIRSPSHHTLVGAWDQTFEVKVITEDEVDREEIADIIMVSLQGSRLLELQKEGVFIRSMNTGGEIETEYSNDRLYMISINLDIRSEWKIHIPINSVVERIGICLTFDTFDSTDPVADGLTINELITTVDQL